jgi:cytochrome c oxidase subunit 2
MREADDRDSGSWIPAAKTSSPAPTLTSVVPTRPVRVVITAAAFAATACSGNQAGLNPHGPIARSVATHGWALLAICTVVYVVVMVAFIIALGRRRQDADDSPETSARLTRNVSIATALTVLTLIGIAASSVVAGRGMYSPSGAGAITVDVVGHQWWWDFQYHDITPSDVFTSPNELHIPVVFRLSSRRCPAM